ncbi:Ig-like domain-containing protein [Lysinibacillus sp. LZ02]|uniref:Ig-like domain-containing protein n=1 Tax=Lysinibacillus sp. LZ02 TaxID=3420668 RepID=UPI003D36F8FA
MLKKSTATIAALFASSTILVNTSFAAPNDNVHKEVQVAHNAEQHNSSKKQQELEKKIEHDKKLEEKKQKEHEKNLKGQEKKLESIDKQLNKIEEKITKYEVKFADLDDNDEDEIKEDDQEPTTNPDENAGEADSEEVNEENAEEETEATEEDAAEEETEATEEDDAEEETEVTEEDGTEEETEVTEEGTEEETEATEEDAAEEETEVTEDDVTEDETEDLEEEIEEAVEEYNDYLGKFTALRNRLNAVVHQLDALNKKGVDSALLTERYDRVAALQEKLDAAVAKITQVQDQVIEKIKNDPAIEVKPAKEEKDPKKEWTVQFNKHLDEKALSELAVVVYDEQQNLVETTMTYNAQKKSIIITPTQAYKAGAQYTLYIGKEITSANGEGLKKSVKMNFTIR